MLSAKAAGVSAVFHPQGVQPGVELQARLWAVSIINCRGSKPGSWPWVPVRMWDQGYSAEGYKASQKVPHVDKQGVHPLLLGGLGDGWKFSAKACWVCSAVCKEK